jgi:arylsulfatase A-like enzyme
VALERSDAQLGRVLAALEEAGLGNKTLVVVVSDHGFLPVREILKPNAVLREAGLLQVGESGRVESWKAYSHADSGSAAIFLAEPDPDGRRTEEVRAAFAPHLRDPREGLLRILDPEEIASLGGGEGAALVLDARDGFYFSNRADGGWREATARRGTHGHSPDRPGMQASWLLRGPGLGRIGDLGVVPMTRIAPTVARFLDLRLSPLADTPVELWEERVRASP